MCGWMGPVRVGGGLGWAGEWWWFAMGDMGKGTGRKTGESKVNLGGASFCCCGRWRRGRWFRWGWINPLLVMHSGACVSTSISISSRRLGWMDGCFAGLGIG